MSILRANSWETTAGLKNQRIISVNSATSTSPYAIGVTTNTWVDWPAREMRIIVYPKSPSSRFLLMASITVASSSNGNSIAFARSDIQVGIGKSVSYHPQIGAYSGFSFGASDGNHNARTISLSYIDSPKSTGKIIYDINLMLEGGTMYLNRTSNFTDGAQVYNALSTSNFTVMEIDQ
jgi:hypothetical protein